VTELVECDPHIPQLSVQLVPATAQIPEALLSLEFFRHAAGVVRHLRGRI
jgi:hypothetical protein